MNDAFTSASDAPSPEMVRELETLRESQRMLTSLLQNLPGIAFRALIDEQWTMLFLSAGCLRLTGFAAEDLIGNRRISYEQLTHPADRDWVRQKVIAALRARRHYDVVYRLLTAEGLVRWVWERGQGVPDEDGEYQFLEGFLTDVTEQRLAEDQVKAQAALLEKARDAILVVDLEGRVLFCNHSAHVLFGWDTSGSCELHVGGIFPQENSAYIHARESVIEHGEWVGELKAVARDGTARTLESRWTLMRDERQQPQSILLINTDVTERNRLEAQVFRAQRMESIGTLAGGIAHDLNNVLAPILTSMELLRGTLSRREDLELLDIGETSARRGADMVKQILAFARGTEGPRVRLELRRILQDLEKLVRETFPRNLTVRFHPARDLWPVIGDATRLHQVLLNLCVNARDAMPGGGLLNVRASNFVTDEAFIDRNPEIVPGSYVQLEVSDTGGGIPEAIRARIFEPFFTTKGIDKGTGLGLSTAQGIVRSYGGRIDVRSSGEDGTTFRILLPATEPEKPVPAMERAKVAAAGDGKLILVVDDEAGVREVTRRMLESFGYRVLAAKNGAEGLVAYAEHREEIVLVITDLMMPIMDGPAMVVELRRQSAELPVIAVTGLAAAENRTRAREAGVQAFLTKPYTGEMLVRAIDELLGSK